MAVSCTTKDPKEAKILTKAVVDAYMTEAVGAEASRQEQRVLILQKLVADKEQELHHRLETLNKLTDTLTPDDAKAAKKPVSVDVQMLRLNVDVVRDFLHEIGIALERAKVELQTPPRVMLLEPAEEPLTPD